MAGSAGMLVAGVPGMLKLDVEDARDTGMLRPAVPGGTGGTCSQQCGDAISWGKGKGRGSVTQDQQKGIFSRCL